uniref:AMP-dependent synthetase/ligase domain-containing protein n=1 Tax=Moniliophthora roreri TaxID=221103 RepID=A0A0W0F7W6_MONRR
MFRTHLDVLKSSSTSFPCEAAFRVPSASSSSQSVEWDTITYQRFYDDVLLFARYWARKLRRDNIPQRSVVGLWLGGFSYTDVLHIYGLSRAGYIPQMFSLRLPNPDVIFELLHKAHARALICDPSFANVSDGCPVPLHNAVGFSEIDGGNEELPSVPAVDIDDVAFYFHTSGSTSGSPKLVPCSYAWINSVVEKSQQVCIPYREDRRDVVTWLGSMCHIGQTFMLIGSLQHGACTVQPTKLPFTSAELMDMITNAGVNRLYQFSAFLSMHFRAARQDPKLASLLTGLDEVLTCGMPLPREDLEWARNSGLHLMNLFGSTEVGGATLLSSRGTHYLFKPIQQSEGAHQSTARLFEFIVMADSPDCPDVSLRSSDGTFHTGDLFQEINGSYVFCGRDDDWIKSQNSLRCDTKAIEDNARQMCGNVISDCIVVGTGRPSPTMFVEASADGVDEAKLKKDILRKTRQFHSRRYMHERIVSDKFIVIVPRGSLPRTATKGNIRRKAVEEMYKDRLDAIYGY